MDCAARFTAGYLTTLVNASNNLQNLPVAISTERSNIRLILASNVMELFLPIWVKETRPHYQRSTVLKPGEFTFAFKGYVDCNWLQLNEVGIDPSHACFCIVSSKTKPKKGPTVNSFAFRPKKTIWPSQRFCANTIAPRLRLNALKRVYACMRCDA